MSRSKKIGTIIIFSFILIILFTGYITINYIYQDYKLKKEIANLSEIDITKDKVNTNIVCRGDYGIVESTIKNYLNDYSNNLESINKIISDDKISKILSYDNMSSDTDFINSIKYINDTKELFNTSIDKLIIMYDENNIKDEILKYNLNKYYVDKYNELMFSDEIHDKLNLSVDYLEEYKLNMNNKFDTCLEIFDFLNNNKDNYVFEDNELKLKTNELIDTYNSYINKIRA